MKEKKQWNEWLWDAWCLISLIGIWPRYIEPKLLEVTRLFLTIPHLPLNLEGLTILHFSDLHWCGTFSPFLQKKLIRKINTLKPDLILFTGDFLSRSKLENPIGLQLTLQSLKAKMGCYAVLGNHDYAQFVTVNKQGKYDIEAPCHRSNISKGFKRLFHPVKLTKEITPQAQQVGYHSALCRLLEQTPFRLLNNASTLIPYKGSWINVCGLEEYTLGRFHPEEAYKDYDLNYPGIILSHNPDTLEILKDYPGELILSGHTHGGQVNLPFLWKRFTQIEDVQFKRGVKILYSDNLERGSATTKKWAYVNRGVSSVMKNFRWFAAPELTFITLKR